MKPTAFDYHAPASPEEAVSLLGSLGDGAKIIAGGQSLTPMLALRLAVFEHLVDIRRIESLRGVSRSNGTVRVGAGTTEAAVGRSDVVAADVPLLARATPFIGHLAIRNRGTIGGCVAHADAAAEYPAVALALDATIETLSPRGTRSIPAAEFFTGIWSTALEPDELITALEFGVWSGRTGFAVEEFAVRSGDFAIAGATVAVELSSSGSVDRCAIGLFGLGPTAVRATAAEESAAGTAVPDLNPDEIGQAALAGQDVPSDSHGSAAYRTRVGAAMVATAWRRAVKEASGE
ncbi:MAG: FAD binding domain-containing protein [Streptosporangiales bacterium]|nr:FAD binding domain-containing protein [Streptosporangiales bacterium]